MAIKLGEKTMSVNVIPKHVAIIMDGNRRWAKQKGLSVVAGHKFVVEELAERLIEHAAKKGVEYITFWAWSTENWKREKREVTAIMRLFRFALEKKVKKMVAMGARVRVIGDVLQFPKDIQMGLKKMMEASKDNQKINVTWALNYGGRDEILQAVKNFTVDSSEYRVLSEDKISQEQFSKHLYTEDISDPDIIIRPGGEKRLSGFMLWQSEYSELYFTDTLMPDFDEGEFDLALEEYTKRQRRRGR